MRFLHHARQLGLAWFAHRRDWNRYWVCAAVSFFIGILMAVHRLIGSPGEIVGVQATGVFVAMCVGGLVGAALVALWCLPGGGTFTWLAFAWFMYAYSEYYSVYHGNPLLAQAPWWLPWSLGPVLLLAFVIDLKVQERWPVPSNLYSARPRVRRVRDGAAADGRGPVGQPVDPTRPMPGGGPGGLRIEDLMRGIGDDVDDPRDMPPGFSGSGAPGVGPGVRRSGLPGGFGSPASQPGAVPGEGGFRAGPYPAGSGFAAGPGRPDSGQPGVVRGHLLDPGQPDGLENPDDLDDPRD